MNKLKLSPTIIFFLLFFQKLNAQISEVQQLKIDSLFLKYDHTHMPGCALAIVKDGEIIYKKGYGMADLERGIVNQPHTVFYAGSISKQFVAGCALLLSEKGLLDLNAPVQKYLDDFPGYGHTITVQHLIYHTSGIKDYFELFEKSGIDYLNQISRNKVYDLIKSQDSLNFYPGEQYSYSNSGYLMLSMIIEQVSGMPLARFVDQEIFKPLGMMHSLFLDNVNRLIPNRALGYHKNLDDQIENMIMRFDLVGSGGLYTTVEDLYLWDQNFYDSKIGSPQFIDNLLTSGTLNKGQDTRYAFAILRDRLLGRTVIGHSGSLGGYRSQFLQFPDEKLSIIILSNLSNFKPGERAHDIAKILLN